MKAKTQIPLEILANVKVYGRQTDGQTDGRTDVDGYDNTLRRKSAEGKNTVSLPFSHPNCGQTSLHTED